MIKKLFGYQNTTPELNEKGVTVTYRGDHYNILDFKINDVDRFKIARSLSREPRYVGDTTLPYSVAQHCVRGSEALLLMGFVKEARQFLYHDSSEAILKDLSSPLKKLLKDSLYCEIEEKIEKVLAKQFGYDYPYSPIVKQLDANLAQEEMSLLMHSDLSMEYDYWDHTKAYKMWLHQDDRIDVMLKHEEKARELKLLQE